MGVERDNISFIQQDTTPYLYFEINLNDYECNFFSKKLKALQEQMEWLIPGKENDYTWMVSLRFKGNIVDSIFGGNTLLPDVGYVV